MTVHLETPVGPRDHVRGPADAPVTLVEYGDFECHFCAEAHPVVRALAARFEHSLRVVFRHAPQTRLHPGAVIAAEAAEAAGAQGRFWDMHDLLFTSRPALTLDGLAGAAGTLGLDVDRFRADVESRRFLPIVTELERSGAHTVRGTPTFFLDGVRFEQGSDVDTLAAAIEAARAGR